MRVESDLKANTIMPILKQRCSCYVPGAGMPRALGWPVKIGLRELTSFLLDTQVQVRKGHGEIVEIPVSVRDSLSRGDGDDAHMLKYRVESYSISIVCLSRI